MGRARWTISRVSCDRDGPADDHVGDCWDHVALDAEHKLVVAVVPGKRTIENSEALVAEFRRRAGGRLMNLMTSDDYSAYETAILHAHGEMITPPRAGRRGRPRASHRVPSPDLTYATATKRREKGRVVEVGMRIVFGTIAAGLATLEVSKVGRAVDTAFVARQHATDRHRNARKARKTYRFSKSWRHRQAVTYLTLSGYNFRWPVRTLTTTDAEGGRVKRSPAMAAGLADHVWSMSEWLSRPALQRS